ncbi:recombinase family protein [Phenylobacterium koreense]|uniref:DNA invertase Pin-like site-specific DNA recombinase n=2 Tax=Phenylobacterium TaxID=20 RepID=A0ABV2EF47_9CAUL
MRLAIVQHRSGLPTTDEQVARVRAMSPDDYLIEETANARAAQRLVERLEHLGEGDGVVVTELAVLAPSLPEVLSILDGLARRGVVVQAFDAQGEVFEVGPASRATVVALAALGRVAPASRSRPKAEPALLSEADQEEIRRLHRAGMTPRRIGLIFRRTPKAIAEVIWGYDPAETHIVTPTRRS